MYCAACITCLHPIKMHCAPRTMHVCMISSQSCDARHCRGWEEKEQERKHVWYRKCLNLTILLKCLALYAVHEASSKFGSLSTFPLWPFLLCSRESKCDSNSLLLSASYQDRNRYCYAGFALTDFNRNNCHNLLITYFFISLFQRIPFLLAMTLTLTQMIAGFPQPLKALDPTEEEHVFPPLESTNGTLK